MTLKPIGDHIIVKPLSAEEKTATGIIIPDTASKERPERGEVVAVGPGRILENGQRSEMPIAVGNKVIFKKYAPDEIKDGNVEYLVIRAEDIMVVIE